MNQSREAKLKEVAEQEYATNQINTATQVTSAAGRLGGYDYDTPKQASLAERVRNRLRDARRTSGRVEQLSELEYLLEKHPEVARILELMEIM